MHDAVEKAQDASARIARKVTEGHVTSARDDQSRRGAMQDPVAVGLGTATCGTGTCEPTDTPPNPDRYQNEGIWPGN